jgi:hypothetical protein
MPTLTATDITQGWMRHFYSADHSLRWIAAEVEHSVWLNENTLLAGRIDALGENEEGPFFGEWKTANPRERNTWKQVWRMNPQSLTYGVLAADWWGARGQVCNQFTVRKAFKTVSVATFDHAWYSYSDAELAYWKFELRHLAGEMRAYGDSENWPVNWKACFQFGVQYACPHFEQGCSKLVWNIDPAVPKRVPHLAIERRTVSELPKDFILLDATRVGVWLSCRERFRRSYVENVAEPVTEALQLGIEVHELLGKYYGGMVK